MSAYLTEKDCELVKIDPEHHEFARRRINFLLTSRGLSVAKNDLSSLLVMAYAQGLSDCAEALDKVGRLK